MGTSILQYIAYPNIAHATGHHKEQLAEELISDHILLHIISGELHIRDTSGVWFCRFGETILIRRNHLVKCGNHPLPGGVPYEIIIFAFEKKMLQDYALRHNLEIAHGSSESSGVVSLEAKPALKSLFDSLATYMKSGKKLSEAMKHHKLNEAILALIEQNENLTQFLFDFADPGKTDLKEFMLRNYMFNIPIVKFAELTGRSLSTFQRDFQKIFGIKASLWLLKQRLKAAHEALLTGRKPSEIYLDLGFGDLSHFSKVFKKEFGYTPSFLKKRDF
jgi:AraC-like DNA-binding protein